MRPICSQSFTVCLVFPFHETLQFIQMGRKRGKHHRRAQLCTLPHPMEPDLLTIHKPHIGTVLSCVRSWFAFLSETLSFMQLLNLSQQHKTDGGHTF